MQLKAILRKRILEQRESLPFAEAERRSNFILDKLRKNKDYQKAKTIMFYVSKGKEVITHSIIKEAMRTKKVIVPKVVENNLICCELTDFDSMKCSKLGILEPENPSLQEISKIDLIIVPGIVFDKRGHRVGYGKGYYDTLLKSAKCKKIGLAYDFQIVEKIPEDEWDEQLDTIITD